MKEKDQSACTIFLSKYGGLYLYDIVFEKINPIDDEDIHFVNYYRYALIGNPNNRDGTSTYHKYLSLMMTCLTVS